MTTTTDDVSHEPSQDILNTIQKVIDHQKSIKGKSDPQHDLPVTKQHQRYLNTPSDSLYLLISKY
jgi:hypothetical protein